MKRLIFLMTLFGLSWSSFNLADGKARYGVCIACHGPAGEGNAALNAPALAGQEDWYLEVQLKNFKTGVRGTHKKDLFGMQMRPMAMVLPDDAAIKEVAKFIGAMSPAKIDNTGKGDPVAGKVHYALCAACHGPEAAGLVNMNSPNLTLQQDWYLVRQLQNFKNGIRGANPKDLFGQQMRPMAMILRDDQAIEDVVAYIATLKK